MARCRPRRDGFVSTQSKTTHFSFQLSIDGRQVKELADLAFAPEATNILLLGSPGVGKTRVVVALAKKAI